jgi:RimJ/RimL family protein N-acetyltransferase
MLKIINELNMTLTIRQATIHHLYKLLEQPKCSSIDGFLLPSGEDVAPDFLMEFLIDRLNQEPENSFWWLPWFVIVDSQLDGISQQLIVGMIGFKNVPDSAGEVEIGYGIVPSQQRQGFATQAVSLLVKEEFSSGKVKKITACTLPLPTFSGRVLAKNKFVRDGTKIDPDDGEVWVWRRCFVQNEDLNSQDAL